MAVNISGIMRNMGRVNVYTPIIEAIVNSIESIEQSSTKDGEIRIRLIRDEQQNFTEDGLAPVRSIEIEDNGVGFTDENLEAFDTLYTEYKIEKGGKGFGRFTFIKFFRDVHCESIYSESNKYYKRIFSFGRKKDIVENQEKEELKDDKPAPKTIIKLTNLEDKHLNRLDKKIETIARRIVEKILNFFVDEEYQCPKIILSDEDNEIVLNDFVKKSESIEFVEKKEFSLTSNESIEHSFLLKTYKIYFTGNQTSSVILCAHNREVTSTPLHNYIPEFKDDFYDEEIKEDGEPTQKNYIIRSYVVSEYLDKHVSLERSEFELPKKNTPNLLNGISVEEIETKAVYFTKGFFKDEVTSRQKKKKERIERYVNTEAPWHKPYLSDLELDNIAFDASEEEIDTSLHRIKYNKEITFKTDVSKALQDDNEFKEKFDEIIKGLTDVSKSDLAHYVVLRKSVIDIFKKSLQYKDDGKYDLEKAVHKIVFPLHSNSDDTPYHDHNLWLIDERLSFHEYVSSDEPLDKTRDRPDILIFGKRILVRSDNELSNPIFVFEFKRPQRDGYADDDDPIKQINRYVEQIRGGNFKAKNGRTIHANKNTPAYGYVIRDLTPKIREFCKDHQLTMSPDEQAYFGYHSTYEIYLEVISFDKLVKESELRNKVFFKKLGLI